MESLKEKFIDWGRIILIILLSSIVLAECLYLFFAVLGHYIDLSFSTQKAYAFLIFVIIVCLGALGYLLYHIYNIKERSTALGCCSKLSNEEYEKMKRIMTRSEVEKLTNSREYKDYLRKSQNFGGEKKRRQEEDSDVILSSESEKER